MISRISIVSSQGLFFHGFGFWFYRVPSLQNTIQSVAPEFDHRMPRFFYAHRTCFLAPYPIGYNGNLYILDLGQRSYRCPADTLWIDGKRNLYSSTGQAAYRFLRQWRNSRWNFWRFGWASVS